VVLARELTVHKSPDGGAGGACATGPCGFRSRCRYDWFGRL